MSTLKPITNDDVIRTAKECSDAIMKRYAVCADAMLGIAKPTDLRADLEALRAAVEKDTGATMCRVYALITHLPAESVKGDANVETD